jgi:hypothetical protein
MFTRLFRNYLKIFMLLAFGGFAIPAFAETGHCNFGLYSKALDRSLKVCQTADSVSQCGVLMRRKYDHSRAHVVRKKGRRMKFKKGGCSGEGVVGVCEFPHRKIFFYEGDTEGLAEGCDRMKGRWDVKRL